MYLNERQRSLLTVVLIAAVVFGSSQLLRIWGADAQGQALRERVRPGDIVMLSSENCLYCVRARHWLDAQHVPYRACFIETDAACRAAYEAHGARGTPMMLVRGQTLVGFDVPGLLEALSPHHPAAAPG
ncbi:glutaredoxin family protein [Roseateles violae]|uniref:Glutaredoxin family protein n=1 Tax=Roseateles violae TaxID=3058042 RepID=A0ABT8DRS3_9BURK|nr:glutaredoxin family protein [Pelomonas sp. PFR6]MDN3920736.1 glutaredoxin family protein [Pelomonas sp. PFR6]